MSRLIGHKFRIFYMNQEYREEEPERSIDGKIISTESNILMIETLGTKLTVGIPIYNIGHMEKIE